MKYSSSRRERLILADPLDSRLRRKVTIWDHIRAALNRLRPDRDCSVLYSRIGGDARSLRLVPGFRRARGIAASIPVTAIGMVLQFYLNALKVVRPWPVLRE